MKAETSIRAILSKMSDIGKCELKFMTGIIQIFLSMRGRYNFCNMARFGTFVEQHCRRNFSKGFDFKTLNTLLVKEYCSDNSGDLIWIFDPSFISKSGRHTPGINYFWSGCAGAMKRGLELCGLAIGDLHNHTALHYHAALTEKPKDDTGLLTYYANLLVKQVETLKKISKYIVVDAFFSKNEFVGTLVQNGMTVISRLPKDALRHAYPFLARRRRAITTFIFYSTT